MLVHICCSVDSHYFLKRIQNDFPNKPLIGYFYNPNIHPKEEYELRLLDVKRSCKMLGIPLIEGEYELNNWLNITKGFEDEPEKGARCSICFDDRLQKSAMMAKKMGIQSFTTTLLMSPKKSLEQLKKEAKEAEKLYNIEFVWVDYRKHGGTQEQFKLAKEDRLYMQDYCGCIYALSKQRSYANKEPIELYSDLFNRAIPNSFKERDLIYQNRAKLEKEKKEYALIKERFLNYRIKRALLRLNKEPIDSYTLFYSITKNQTISSEIRFLNNKLAYAPKFDGYLMSLELLNEFINSNYQKVIELYKKPLELSIELELRAKITKSAYSLSPIVIVDALKMGIYELFLDSHFFVDTKDVLLLKD